MSKLILLTTCLLLGFLLRRTKYFDDNSPLVLNNLLIYFFVPLLSLYHIPKIDFAIEQLWLSISPFIVYGSSFLFIHLMGLWLPMEQKTKGALIMCSGIGSISFVGFPIFELLYGQEGLSYGIILSLAGTFLVFNTVGISTGFYYASETSHQPSFFVKKMLSFPPFIAFVLALLINLSQIPYPMVIETTLKNLTAPFSVLALLAIGMQINFSFDRAFIRLLLIGQFHKLLIAPLLLYFLMWHIFDIQNVVGRICILGAAIGSMNAISILAAQMGLHPKLSTLMPALGIPLSIPLLFLIDLILQ
ncbi:MAG: AEC family transporter [Bacteroidota bacterium]